MATRTNIEIVFETKGAQAAERAMGGMGRSAKTAKVAVKGLGAQWNLFKAGLSISMFRQVRQELAAWVRPLVETQRQLDQMRNSMIAATGSMTAARSELGFVREESERLGLNLAATSLQYARFAAAAKGSGVEAKEVRRIFVAVSESATVLALSSEQTQGAFRAIEQIMSKGRVQAEELRGQLAERIPGAFEKAARGIGMTVQELNRALDRGLVNSKEALIGLANALEEDFADKVPAAVDTLERNLVRANNTFFDLFTLISKESAGAANVMVKAFTEGIKVVGLAFLQLKSLLIGTQTLWLEFRSASADVAGDVMDAVGNFMTGNNAPGIALHEFADVLGDEANVALREYGDLLALIKLGQEDWNKLFEDFAKNEGPKFTTGVDGANESLDRLNKLLDDAQKKWLKFGRAAREAALQSNISADLLGIPSQSVRHLKQGPVQFAQDQARDYVASLIIPVSQTLANQVAGDFKGAAGRTSAAFVQAAGIAAGALINFLQGRGDVGSALGAVGGTFGGILAQAMGAMQGSPWGAVASMGLSVAGGILGDLFGSKQMTNAERIARDAGIRIGEKLADAIMATANDILGGDQGAAMSIHLGDIIEEEVINSIGQLNKFRGMFQAIIWDFKRGALSASQAIGAVTDAFGPLLEEAVRFGDLQTFEQLGKTVARFLREVVVGTISAAQANELLEETFPQLAAAARDFGAAGLMVMRNLIVAARATGEEFEAINKFIAKGVDMMLSAAEKVINSGVASNRDLQQAGLGLARAFREAAKQGLDLLALQEKWGPLVTDLVKRYRELGLEVPVHLKQLKGFLRKLSKEEVQALIVNLQGVGDIIHASIALAIPPTQKAFEQFQKTINQTYEDLRANGLTGKQAIQVILPSLLDAAMLARDFGFELDENTKRLLEQAGIDINLLPDSERNIMLRGFEGIIDKLSELIDLISTVPGIFNQWGEAINDIPPIPGPPPPGGGVDPPWWDDLGGGGGSGSVRAAGTSITTPSTTSSDTQELWALLPTLIENAARHGAQTALRRA